MMKNYRFLTLTVLLVSLLLGTGRTFATGSSLKWVGTWGTAPQLVESGNMPPSPGLTNNSIRQIVRVSIGGDTIQLKFSNEFSTTAVTLKAVQIAVSKGGKLIDTTTAKMLTFKGQTEVTMDSGATATSDAFAFKLEPRMDLAITIYFGQTSTTVTGHPGSRTTSYILKGDGISSADFTGSVSTDHWYVIKGIDVKANDSAACVSIIGNSITDGRGTTTNLQNRWTDVLSEALLKDSLTKQVGVLNMGLGGNCVLGFCLGPSGVSRFDRDVLGQEGVRWGIVFEGVNDIGGVKTAEAATTVANGLINAYKEMIAKAHKKNIRLYGATIMPFKGNGYYNQYSDLCRVTVNEWIRYSGCFNAVIDFDKTMRTTADTSKLAESYQNDGLHPTASMYKQMGESVDLNLFKTSDTVFSAIDSTQIGTRYYEAECAMVGDSFEVVQDAQASNMFYVTVKAGLNSTAEAPSDKACAINLPFTVTKDTTYYVFARLKCPSANDDSYWVSIDSVSFKMVNGLGTNGWQWLRIDSVPLKAGNHILSIAYREDGANLDKLCITNSIEVPTAKGKPSEYACISEIPVKVGIQAVEKEEGYKLENYPNPFNSKTKIAFEIPADTYVSIKVYNVFGAEVADLTGKEYCQGKYSVEFDARNIPNGVYLCELATPDVSISRKIIFQK